MKKVFMVHGFEGSPNGGWRPWLLGELAKLDIYACALAMPSPDAPLPAEWVAEIARHVERSAGDEVYLVGHSLGVPAILRYLQTAPTGVHIAGAVLVSGPAMIRREDPHNLNPFLAGLNFGAIAASAAAFAVIHGDDDEVVPVDHARLLARELGCACTLVPHGGHLNGSAGWLTLPPVVEALTKMFY